MKLQILKSGWIKISVSVKAFEILDLTGMKYKIINAKVSMN